MSCLVLYSPMECRTLDEKHYGFAVVTRDRFVCIGKRVGDEGCVLGVLFVGFF